MEENTWVRGSNVQRASSPDKPKFTREPRKQEENIGFITRSEKPIIKKDSEESKRPTFVRGVPPTKEDDTAFVRGNFNKKSGEEKKVEKIERPATKTGGESAGGFGFRNTNKIVKK